MNIINKGADLIDVGGESTRPDSKAIHKKIEWRRIESTIKFLAKKIPLSLDTRKSEIMRKGIELGVKLIKSYKTRKKFYLFLKLRVVLLQIIFGHGYI